MDEIPPITSFPLVFVARYVCPIFRSIQPLSVSVRFSTSECPIRNYDPPLFPCASIAISHYLLDRSTHRFVKHPWNSPFFPSPLFLSFSFPFRFDITILLLLFLFFLSFVPRLVKLETTTGNSSFLRQDDRSSSSSSSSSSVYRSAVPLKLLRNYLKGGRQLGRENDYCREGRVVGSNEGNASFVSQRLERIDELPSCSFEGRDYSFWRWWTVQGFIMGSFSVRETREMVLGVF